MKNYIFVARGMELSNREIKSMISKMYGDFNINKAKLRSNLNILSKHYDGKNTIAIMKPLVSNGVMPPPPPNGPGQPDQPDLIPQRDLRLFMETTENKIYHRKKR